MERAQDMGQFTFIDLFCGAGGFTEGMLLSGGRNHRFRLIAASDIHKNAQATHENRYRRQLGIDYSFLCQDVRSRNLVGDLVRYAEGRCNGSSVDVVVGGPPCQGFSVFGARQETDPRNDLFLPYLKIIAAIKPKYFVMENVPGLAMMYGGKTVDRIYSQVKKLLGYAMTGPIRVCAADHGVPQLRERILFIGNRKDMEPLRKVPSQKQQRVSVKKAIGDLAFLRSWESATEYMPDHPATTQYQLDSRSGRLLKQFLGSKGNPHELTNHEAAKHSPGVIARFSMIRPGAGLDSIPRELWEGYLKSSKKWCVKLDPNKPSFTVVTLPDDFVHYEQPRILTVREMARLQSFDDTFVFLGPRASGGGGRGNKKRNSELPQYSQVGNAVPPLLAKAIGNLLLHALDNQKRTQHNAIPARIYSAVECKRQSATA